MSQNGDIQIGFPARLFGDTEAEIEAISHDLLIGGEKAYALDTGREGLYNGLTTTWDWEFGYSDLLRGNNEILNSDFTLNADEWTLGPGWAWVDGVGIQHTPGDADALSQSGLLIDAIYYIVSLSVTGTVGGVLVSLDDGDSLFVDAGAGIVEFVGQYLANIPNKISIAPTGNFDGAIEFVEEYRSAFFQSPIADNVTRGLNNGHWVPVVETVTGDGADNTDPTNPVLTFPTPAEIGAATTDVATTSAAGLAPQATAPAAGLLSVLSIINGATAYSLNDFATWVRSALLTGFSTAVNAAATAADTVLVALGKLQAQITGLSGGWTVLPATLTYSSADAPTYIVSSNADLTTLISVGMKIKMTNNSLVPIGIITALGTWSGSAQLITIYCGTDYVIANSAITLPYYSSAKSPQGFPTSPAKWTQTVTDASARYFTPTDSVWAVPTSSTANLAIPIGVWKVRYMTTIRDIVAGGTYANAFGTLSTTTNSETDATTTARITTVGISTVAEATGIGFATLTLAAKTTYHLLFLGISDGTHGATCGFDGPATIIAECAYL